MNCDQASSAVDRGGPDGGGDEGVVDGGGIQEGSGIGSGDFTSEENTSRSHSKPVPAWLNSSLWSSSAVGGGGVEGVKGVKGGTKETTPKTNQPRGDKLVLERGNEYIPRVSLGRRSSEKENHESWSESVTTAPRQVSPPQRHLEPPHGRLMSPRSQLLPTSTLFSGPGLLQRFRLPGEGPLQGKSVREATKNGDDFMKSEQGSGEMEHDLPPTGGDAMEAEEEMRQQIPGGRLSSASLCMAARIAQFHAELSKERVNIVELRRLASQGIPDGGSLRSLVWKLLLGYLPTRHGDWNASLEKKRSEYQQFKVELIINPSEAARQREEAAASMDKDLDGTLDRQDITHEDHPLNMGSSSIWNQYFQDVELAEQIDRDVKRTHPDMHFFNSGDEQAEENQAAMKRALFIFAKLNPGVRYVQGMNEVLAPLLYVFKTDPDSSNSACAEEDAFFCFVELLSNFRDNFCQQLDNSSVGIRSTISRLSMLLRQHDDELWHHLDQKNKVNPQFYAFRWITLLLTQEFSFPDSLRLWDSLLSDPDGPLDILLRVCCAMLVCSRDQLLKGDFAANLKLLQNFPPVDVHHILATAEQFRPSFM